MYPVDGFRGRPILATEFPMIEDVFRDVVRVRYPALGHDELETLLSRLSDLHRIGSEDRSRSVQ
ncbi:hypothetical protein B0E45_18990 [Sinorhizobium sp. A49]|nr:hypothetical protein B0E45_18990 [Sinorhizobium sp. A49]